MACNSIRKVTYDNANDVLYVNFIPHRMAYGDEYGGVVLMRDMDTDEVIGLTIFNPKSHPREREKDLIDVANTVGFDFNLNQVSF